MVKNLPAMQTWVQSLGQEDHPGDRNGYPLSILAWEIPWTEEPGGLQSVGLKEKNGKLTTYKKSFQMSLQHRSSSYIPTAKYPRDKNNCKEILIYFIDLVIISILNL